MKTMTKDELLIMSEGVVEQWNKKIKALLVVKKKMDVSLGNDEDAGEIKVF